MIITNAKDPIDFHWLNTAAKEYGYETAYEFREASEYWEMFVWNVDLGNTPDGCDCGIATFVEQKGQKIIKYHDVFCEGKEDVEFPGCEWQAALDLLYGYICAEAVRNVARSANVDDANAYAWHALRYRVNPGVALMDLDPDLEGDF